MLFRSKEKESKTQTQENLIIVPVGIVPVGVPRKDDCLTILPKSQDQVSLCIRDCQSRSAMRIASAWVAEPGSKFITVIEVAKNQ